MAKPIAVLNGEKVFEREMTDMQVKVIKDDEIEIIGSTAGMDRDQEVIDPKAWDIKHYKQNPVVLPAHDYRQPAIGKATSVKMQDGKLTFRIKFPPEGDNPVADIYRKLYKGGYMTASSVGFMPREWVDGDGKKNTPWRTYTKAELLELSLVSVPANPEALTTERGIKSAVKDGVITSADVKVLEKHVRELFEAHNKGGDQVDVKELPKASEPKVKVIDKTATTSSTATSSCVEWEWKSDDAANPGQDDPKAKSIEELNDRIAALEKRIEAVDKLKAELEAMTKRLEATIDELTQSDKHYLDIDDPTKPAKMDAEKLREAAKAAFAG